MLVSLVDWRLLKPYIRILPFVSLAHLGFHKMITEAKGVAGEELHPATTSFALFFLNHCMVAKEPKGARDTGTSCINKV
jgi:hypothetical protein